MEGNENMGMVSWKDEDGFNGYWNIGMKGTWC